MLLAVRLDAFGTNLIHVWVFISKYVLLGHFTHVFVLKSNNGFVEVHAIHCDVLVLKNGVVAEQNTGLSTVGGVPR